MTTSGSPSPGTPPPASDTTAPQISNVAAGAISNASATITWSTNEPATSRVEYGTTATYGSGTTETASRVTSHSVTLSGLTASTTYHYRVRSRDAADNTGLGNDVTFTTSAISPPAAAGDPALHYSDLDSGPNTGGQDSKGVYVTVWGKGFGATRGNGYVSIGNGAADNYPLWSDTKIVFQLGANAASGNIVVRNNAGANSNGIGFTVRSGRTLFVTPNGTGNGAFATPMSPYAVYSGLQAGDTYYFRAGTYDRDYDTANWNESNYNLGANKSGTVGNPVAFVGYPGETAVIQTPAGSGRSNFDLRDGGSVNDHPNYITIANLTLRGEASCINGGAVTAAGGEIAQSGTAGMRVVGNVLSANYTGNTMTALITVGGNGARVLGNELKDTGTTPPINNNHGIYVQVGSSDVDVAWNYLHNLRMGHVIQVHTDTAFLYTNVRIHDNVITATNPGDSRGITVSNMLAGSGGVIYNNVLYNLGQGFSGISVYNGNWKIYHNTLYAVSASTGMVWLDSNRPTAEIYNNIFYSNGSSPYVGTQNGASLSQVTLSNNLYYNRGNGPAQDAGAVNADPLFVNAAAGNFRLQSTSPAIDTGTTLVNAVVSTDRDGNPRPQGGGYDIGAFEFISP